MKFDHFPTSIDAISKLHSRVKRKKRKKYEKISKRLQNLQSAELRAELSDETVSGHMLEIFLDFEPN